MMNDQIMQEEQKGSQLPSDIRVNIFKYLSTLDLMTKISQLSKHENEKIKNNPLIFKDRKYDVHIHPKDPEELSAEDLHLGN